MTTSFRGSDGSDLAVRECNAADWGAALDLFAGATPFHETGWLMTAAADRGADLRWFAVDDEAGVVGVIPMAIRGTPLGTTVNVLPFPYVGPIHRDARATDMLHATRLLLVKLRPIKARMTFAAGLRRSSPDEALIHESNVEADTTFVIDVGARSEDDFYKSLSSSSRKALNFARREGVQVQVVSTAEVAEVIETMHRAIYARQGLAAEYSRNVIAKLASEAASWAQVRGSVAYRGAEPRAAQIAFHYRGNTYNWVGAAHRDRGVMNLVEWETLMWAKSHGADVVDLVGAPTPGVAAFKTSLGATPRQFCVLNLESRRYRAGVAIQRRLAGFSAPAQREHSSE